MGTAGCGCGKCSIHSAVHGDCPNPDPECRIPALQAPYNSRSLHNLLEHVCCQCEVRNFTDLTNMVQLLLKTEYCAKLSEIADYAELRFHICSYYPVFKDYLEMESKGTKKSLIDCFYDYVIHNYLWISDKHIERLRKLAVTLGAIDAARAIDGVEQYSNKFFSSDGHNIVHVSEPACFPSHCQHAIMEQYVFLVDEGFKKVPCSELTVLYHRL